MNAEILKINEKLIIVNKPIGLPTTYKNENESKSDCVVKQIGEKYPEIYKVHGYKKNEGGLIYRLDNDTSGIILLARDQTTFDYYKEKQEHNKLLKSYLAISIISKEGISDISIVSKDKFAINPQKIADDLPSSWPKDFSLDLIENQSQDTFGTNSSKFAKIDIPIAHSHKSSKRMIAVINPGYKFKGKPIETTTFVRVIKTINNQAFIEAKITKGCRHQIRVHLKSIGLPIVGDKLYAPENQRLEKMRLHCYMVEIID
ncbi:RNA pseudouridine synthase [Candidatus Dojkabacteria bacterium]|nr:RNA pseudouridine synthase [Candidatus Dojkabacteria bacterium]